MQFKLRNVGGLANLIIYKNVVKARDYNNGLIFNPICYVIIYDILIAV